MCKLEFGWRLHRKIGRFLTFKDSVDVTRRLPIGRLFDHFISTAGQRSSAAISANCSLRPSAKRHQSQRFVATKYQRIEIARK